MVVMVAVAAVAVVLVVLVPGGEGCGGVVTRCVGFSCEWRCGETVCGVDVVVVVDV